MSFSELYYFLKEYSVDKIALAIIAFSITVVLKRTLFKKKQKRFASLLPFLSGIILNLVVCLFKKSNDSFGSIMTDGIATGSAGTVIYAFAESLTGKADYEEVALDSFLFEGILAGYAPADSLPYIAERCAEILRADKAPDEQLNELTEEIANSTSADSAQALMLAKLMQNILIGTGNK